MGLKQDFRLEYGLQIANVYMKAIVNYLDSSKCSYHFELYYRDGAEKKRMQAITSKDFLFTPDNGKGILKQIYTHAKGLPIMAGALDDQGDE